MNTLVHAAQTGIWFTVLPLIYQLPIRDLRIRAVWRALEARGPFRLEWARVRTRGYCVAVGLILLLQLITAWVSIKIVHDFVLEVSGSPNQYCTVHVLLAVWQAIGKAY